MDSQSVKTTEESSHPSGYDIHKNVKGRKRRLLVEEQGGWELEIVERSSSADTEGFVVLPRRCIVERTLEWLMRNRRLSKDYERLVQTSGS